MLVDVSSAQPATTILGQKVAAPLVLAPIGLCGMQHGDGEILAARRPTTAGIPLHALDHVDLLDRGRRARRRLSRSGSSSTSSRTAASPRTILTRAAQAKCSALVLTVDLQVLGQRHRDIKNGMTVPPEIRLGNIIDIATKPAWAWSILKGKRKTFGNLAGHVKGMENVNSLAHWIAQQFDPALSWKDVEWIKNIWPGKLILKGILDVEDARTAVKLGADAIVVSNHGGRQLDGAPSSISMLPKVADAVGSDIEVLFDGGIRTGADIMRALALGARACMIGRAYIYGLGAGGRGRRRQGDRHSEEGARRRHGAHRHQPRRRYRPRRDRRDGGEEEAGAEARSAVTLAVMARA